MFLPVNAICALEPVLLWKTFWTPAASSPPASPSAALSAASNPAERK